jgi:hypothetical protein
VLLLAMVLVEMVLLWTEEEVHLEQQALLLVLMEGQHCLAQHLVLRKQTVP